MKRLDAALSQENIDLKGKTVAISGATGGLGRELCKILSALGADLVLLDRNRQKSLSLIEELRAEFADIEYTHVTVDLEDIEAVRSAAQILLQSVKPDYLILNAGAYSIPRKKCSTGFDNVFQINFISPYFLARKLLEPIEEKGGKIVVVGSIAHNYSRSDADDVDFSRRRAASKVYGNAKRYLTYSLIDEGSVNVTHPGIAVTGITGHYPKLVYALIKYPMKLIFMKPRKACLSILQGLFDNCGNREWIGPRVFNIWGRPKKKPLRTCDAEEAAYIRKKADEIFCLIDS